MLKKILIAVGLISVAGLSGCVVYPARVGFVAPGVEVLAPPVVVGPAYYGYGGGYYHGGYGYRHGY